MAFKKFYRSFPPVQTVLKSYLKNPLNAVDRMNHSLYPLFVCCPLDLLLTESRLTKNTDCNSHVCNPFFEIRTNYVQNRDMKHEITRMKFLQQSTARAELSQGQVDGYERREKGGMIYG